MRNAPKNLFSDNGGNPPKPKNNPFASVSFASSSQPETMKKPVFSFMPTTTKTTSSSSSSTTMTEVQSSSFLQNISSLIQKNPFVNLTNVCNEFMTNAEASHPPSSTTTTTTTTNKTNESTKTSLTFGFNSSTSSKADSESNPTKFKFSGFGSSSTSNDNNNNNLEKGTIHQETSTLKPKPFTSFNFLSSSTTTASSNNPTTTSSKNNNEEEDDSKKDDPAEVIRETNDKEDVTYETRAKYLKMGADKKWKAYSTGALRLYKNKTSNTSRLVLRNEIGKVTLNIAIYKGMQFTKNLKPKKNLGFVGFVAIADEKVGMEKFNLLVKLEEVDKLLDSLGKLTT